MRSLSSNLLCLVVLLVSLEDEIISALGKLGGAVDSMNARIGQAQNGQAGATAAEVAIAQQLAAQQAQQASQVRF